VGNFNKANDAAPSGDGRPKPEDLVNHLLIVRVIAHKDDNPIGIKREREENGVKVEYPADCVIADVVDLDAEGQPAYYDYIFLQAKLIAHFKTNVGNTLIGTLGKYPDMGQRKGAYYFTDQAGIPRIVAVGDAWANNNPEFFTAQAPGSPQRQTRQSNGGPAQDHGQHSNSPGGEEAWAKVHGARSTLEQMRNSGNGGGFDDEKVPF
jgi:hypothetical protein